MSKSSFLNNKKLDKADIAVLCILVMFSGFLVSRFLLSVGMILFGINALRDIHPRQWLQQKYWLSGVAWVLMYALSGFWSEDKDTWGVMLQLKLPILLLPLSFAFIPRFTTKQLQALTVSIATMLLLGVMYSLSFLVLHYEHYIKEYNVSHMIPTPVYSEYICFSASISIFIVWCIFFWSRLATGWMKWFIAISVAVLALYVHILASKSGLVDFYLFLIAWAIYTIISKRSIYGILLIVAIPVVFMLGIKYIPTLHERKEHVMYSWYVFKTGDQSGKMGDLARLISYDISAKIIQQHPLQGVGTGDMLAEMKKGYAQWYPAVTAQTNMLIPHNQFLTVTLGCGYIGGILFFIWAFFPLLALRKNRESVFFFIVWLLLFVQLLIEPFLEGQFGVFLYVFFLLLFRHNLTTVTQKAINTTENQYN